MSVKLALSPENREFCLGIKAFCEEHRISGRKLSAMCDGNRNQFLSTSVHRFFHGDSDDIVVERIRPIIAQAFVTFLEDRGFFPDELEAELSGLFDPKEYTKMIANRCPLTPEAIIFHRLKTDPFDVDHLPFGDELYTNPELDSVTNRVKDAVMYQRFVAVVGGVGTGKTLLKLRVANELAEVGGKARLLYPEFFDMEELSVPNIANALLAELGQVVPRDKSQRVTKLRETLTQLQQEGIGVALVLDEAHRLRDKVISSLKNFWEMTNGKNSRLLGVILFGQPAFVDSRLRDAKFKEIRQRVQIIEMPELRSSPPFKGGVDGLPGRGGSASAYIAHRLQIAGGDITELFETKAVERICSNAVTPLALGNLANEALMEAFRNEEPKVSVSFEMFKKLGTGQQVLGVRRTAA